MINSSENYAAITSLPSATRYIHTHFVKAKDIIPENDVSMSFLRKWYCLSYRRGARRTTV